MESSLAEFAEQQELLSTIQKRYETAFESVRIGERMFEILRVADPDTLLEDVVGNDAQYQPYWAAAWESAEVLARWLLDRDLEAVDVLEIGCGLGVVGTVAASLGASVLMSDAVPDSLLFARYNSWHYRRTATVQRLDWRKDRLPQQFPVILGSDIAYDREEWPYLDRFWQQHLSENGEIWLSEPGRQVGTELLQWLNGSRWECVSHELGPSAIGNRMRIIHLRRKQLERIL